MILHILPILVLILTSETFGAQPGPHQVGGRLDIHDGTPEPEVAEGPRDGAGPTDSPRQIPLLRTARPSSAIESDEIWRILSDNLESNQPENPHHRLEVLMQVVIEIGLALDRASPSSLVIPSNERIVDWFDRWYIPPNSIPADSPMGDFGRDLLGRYAIDFFRDNVDMAAVDAELNPTLSYNLIVSSIQNYLFFLFDRFLGRALI
jgi:hypothetical protein